MKFFMKFGKLVGYPEGNQQLFKNAICTEKDHEKVTSQVTAKAHVYGET